jgi:hypothetical protein
MKHFKSLVIIILTALLCSCGREAATVLETTVTADTTVTTDTTTAATTTGRETKATASTTKQPMVEMDVPKPIQYEYDEEDGTKYALYSFIIAIHSDAEEVTVKPYSRGIHFRVGNLLSGILQSEVSQLPNCRVLNFAEGIENVNWCDSYVNAPNLEILRFPADTDNLYLERACNLIPESEAIWEEACIPYDPSLVGFDSSTPIGKSYTAESFRNAQKLSLCYGSFVTRDTLTHIEIAEGNRAYYDRDGVLFTKTWWRDDDFHMPYAGVFTERPTAVMVCFPQSHPATDGTYAVPDDTQAMLSGAIYRPKHIERLIVPDSLLYISPTAIIATADHPLTVVCSRDSAAAAYVEKYGEMYHLTVEFTD